MPPETLPSEPANETEAFRAAFDRCHDEIDAVPDSDLVPITLDIPSAAATALGMGPALRTLEPLIAKLPSVDLARLRRLELYALAAMHCHTRYLTATRPSEPLAELVAEGMELRTLLHSDAKALVKRGYLDPKSIEDYHGGTGRKTLVVDLDMLQSVLRGQWASIEGKTAVEPAELDRAARIAKRILTAVGEREMTPAGVAETVARRQRAFSLLVRTYDEARRAVTFLRWHEGDADAIAPSLYAGRGNGNQRRRDEDAPKAATPTVNAPAGVAATNASSTGGVAPTGVAPAATTTSSGTPEASPVATD